MTPPNDVSAPLAENATIAHAESSAPLWYKDAIIYQLHVKAFFDANDDGIGDFEGLRHKLDYLQDLGVTALWLLPFYPSPLRDDGYDISDYRAINSSYGGMHDFRMFVREAHRRNIRVITELVINTPRISIRGSSAPAGQNPDPTSVIFMFGVTTTRNFRTRASFSLIPKNRTGLGTQSRRPITGTASTRTSRI